MATATPTRPNPAAAARDAAVEQAIAAAAGKVRANDLTTGGAAAAVLVLAYLAVMVTLDKLLALPDWVRLLGLVGLLGGLAAVAYFLIVRPMQRRVNPRYIARKIEQTLPDAKNVLINWVDLQDEQLPGSVKAAVGANAAAGVADADVDSATSSKPVVWLGSAAAVLVLVLAVLFLVFSGPQFLSLLQRAVVPFKPAEIATATTISIDEPEGGDVTVIDGQPLTIAVSLGGRIPNPDGPDKPRLLVRYNPQSDETVELPMTQAGSSKEFRIDLGRGTILNGFWYRVAAADARTPEHHATVVTRPMLSEFVATYDYPAYLKWASDTERGTKLRALRGTTVTLTAKANRTVQSARLTAATVDGTRELVPGEVFGDARDQVRFKLKLRESGTYRIDFKPVGPELSTATADYPIEVEVDAKPVVEITSPKEEEVQLPVNGTLAVDGTAKDDHGLVGMELRFQLAGDPTLAIKPKAFRDGKPLVREQDGTHLTDIPDYKDSVKLDALTDADGKPVKLKETDVLEYWLAATDNCEPQANVGESARKKVRLTAAVKEPEKKQEQDARDQQRKQDEGKTEQKRDEQLKNEKRPEEQNRNPNKDPQHQPEKQPDGSKPNDDPMKGEPQGKPEGQQGDGTPQDQEEQKKAEDLKKKLEQQREQKQQEAGDARGDGDKSEGQETKPEANTKPPEGKEGGDGSKGAAEGKEGPKPDDMTKPNTQPSEGKDGGRLADPERAKGKEPPKPDAKGEDKPTGDQQKNAPKDGAEAGTSKESKEQPSPQPNDPKRPEDQKKDGSAGSARGAEPPPQGDKPQDPMGNQGSEQPKGGNEKKVDPKDLGGSKPKGEPERGTAKPEPKGGEKGEQQKDAGEAKGDTPNKPAESKGAPQGNEKEPKPQKGPPSDATQEKQPPKDGADAKDDPAQGKGEGPKPQKPPMDGGKGQDDKGSAKPSDTTKKPDPKDQTGNGEKQPDSKQGGGGEKQPDNKDPMGNGQKPDEKDPMKGGGSADQKKPDPKEMEQAMKDLQSKDEKTKQAAQEKLDKAVGKENREQIEQMQKDLQSKDKDTREAAQKKLDEMAKKAQEEQKNGGGGQQEKKELTEQEKKDLIDAAKKLDSNDPKEKKDAQDKLDKAMGKENREKLEQMQKDLKSDNKDTREAAEQKLQEMAKQAQKGQKDSTAQKPEPTEEQKKEWADAAQKLNSKDDAERKAAEQKLDDAIGKKNREELQQDLKDLQGNDLAKAEQARKKLEKKVEEAKNAKNGNSDKHNDTQIGGGNNTTPGELLKANLENQLKNEELKLDDFKKYRGDKKFLKDNDLTEEQFERFLKKEEEAVQKLRERVADAQLNPKAEPTGPPTVGRNGYGKVQERGKTDALQGSGGPAVAPPGFADAVKRFSNEASKQSK